MDSEIARNHAFSTAGAWAIVAALAAEVIGGIGLRDLEWLHWLGVAANFLIGLGVYAEIRYGGRAHGGMELKMKLAEARTAEANERAAEANKETEKLRAYSAQRSLTAEQRNAFIELKGKVAKVHIISVGGGEIFIFAGQIAGAFSLAQVEAEVMNTLSLGITAFGVSLVVPDSVTNLQDNLLSVVLLNAGLTVNMGFPRTQYRDALEGFPEDVPIIIVGDKLPLLPKPQKVQ